MVFVSYSGTCFV